MLEYLISGGNLVLLVGCFYVAYLILMASPACARISRKAQKAPSGSADHEMLFRNPVADYYI